MGAQDSLLKAVLTSRVLLAKRSTAFGVFDTGFGNRLVSWQCDVGFLIRPLNRRRDSRFRCTTTPGFATISLGKHKQVASHGLKHLAQVALLSGYFGFTARVGFEMDSAIPSTIHYCLGLCPLIRCSQ